MTQAFNLSQLANNVNTSGLLNAAAGLYNQTPVANGGTGVASVASGNILVGAGTAAMTPLAGGTVGDVVTWNGTEWVSAAGAGGPAPVTTIYTSPATWTKPASVKAVKVTVVGGGGSAGTAKSKTIPVAQPTYLSGGGGGGAAIATILASAIPGPVTVTVGAGGAGVPAPAGSGPGVNGPFPTPGTAGGTSSFGALVSATGGGAGGFGGSETAGGTATTTPTQLGITGGKSFGTSSFQGGNGALALGLPSATLNTSGAAYGGGSTSYGIALGSPSGTPAMPASQPGAAGIVIVEEFY